MSRQSDLRDFTRGSLSAGRPPEEIAAALAEAGWSAAEIRDAIGAWDIRPGLPPVPRRPRAALTAGDALREGLHLIALAMVTWNLAQLLLALVDIWLPARPDPVIWRIAELRWAVAALAVFLPLWLWAGRATRPAPGQRRTALSVWIGHAAILLAVVAILGDALAVIYRFLGGELTPAFLLKAAAVVTIAALVMLASQERRHD